MTEELIRFCAPTLAALKTAGAFTYPFEERWALETEIHRLNGTLKAKGILILPLRVREGRALIYAFRPSMLACDLNADVAKGILSAYKYPPKNLELQISYLAERLEGGEHFPHEMGLFLGYPPLDVLGFILNGGERYKRAGLWKVYSNEEDAQKQFMLYKKCTAVYLHRYQGGEGIEKLTVKTVE